ncbi:HAD family hydrolase [Selenihalanaerobacter shriftii]|uniref:FMN phosphatase YigB, HAD superfamily n=1 Tax=Selenihalanaerobacter shriftii TaxID=142842 RepID=A0A1T4JJX9_9FIRM|nr:HAD family hydrolase [Selenihalanaerobacter shriftii]SJZ30475.1 FMN phosphatase YigB, HAD superfamily [Selenihalanaerobacter shriftii]
MDLIKGRDTVLFDLDGTLLPIELDVFLENYFQALTKEFMDVANPNEFINMLMKATGEMINNNGEKLNQEVFMEAFIPQVEIDDKTEIIGRFDQFYREKFPLLKENWELNNISSELVKLFKDLGYRMVIATNPLFPREAVVERMRWVGLNPDDFDLVTSYENMHYSKPNLKYYQEIMDKVNTSPQNCIMIGNDVQEDMVVGKLGVTTFLINDFLINRESKEQFEPDWQGSMVNLKSLVKDKF